MPYTRLKRVRSTYPEGTKATIERSLFTAESLLYASPPTRTATPQALRRELLQPKTFSKVRLVAFLKFQAPGLSFLPLPPKHEIQMQMGRTLTLVDT